MSSGPVPEGIPDDASLERLLHELAAARNVVFTLEQLADGWEAEFKIRSAVPGAAGCGIGLLGAQGATRHEAMRRLYELAASWRPPEA